MRYSRASSMLRTSLSVALTLASLTLWYIREHNRLTELRIKVPKLEKEVAALDAEKIRLEFEVEQFMSPSRLEEISRRAQYSHLKQIEEEDVVELID